MLPQDGRTMLATMIQSSTVDLFHATGIAVAPVVAKRPEMETIACHDLMAMISFSGPGASGSLGLLLPTAVFELVKQDAARPFTGIAFVQDSVNQLLGRIKARLLQFQVVLQMGLPISLSEQSLKLLTAQGMLGAFRFRTLRGEISVLLSGKLDFGKLNYSNQVSVASEGDIIVF